MKAKVFFSFNNPLLMTPSMAPFFNDNCIEGKYLATSFKQGTNFLFDDFFFTDIKSPLIALWGQNGIGKSTFLKCIAGLLPIKEEAQKELLINQQSYPSFFPKKELFIAYKSSQIPFYKNFSVKDYCAFSYFPYRGNKTLQNRLKEQTFFYFQEFHAIHLFEKQLYQLSDGQLQLVDWIRTLSQQTPLLILDEAYSYIDFEKKFFFSETLLKILKKEKRMAILTVQDLEFISTFFPESWEISQDSCESMKAYPSLKNNQECILKRKIHYWPKETLKIYLKEFYMKLNFFTGPQ